MTSNVTSSDNMTMGPNGRISPSYRRMTLAFAALSRGEMIIIRDAQNRAALLRGAEFVDYDNGQMQEIADSGIVLCMRRQHVQSLGRKATGTRPVFTTPLSSHLIASASQETSGLSLPDIFNIALGQAESLPAHISLLGEAEDSLADLGTKILRQARLLPTALLATLTSDDPQHHNSLAAMYGLPIVNAFDSAHHDSGAHWHLTKGARAKLPLASAPDAEIIMFRSEGGEEDHFAIIVGAGDTQKSPFVRLHSQCVTGDVLGSLKCDCGPQLQTALAHMSQNGGGVLLYLAQEGRDIGLMNKIRAYGLQDSGHDTVDANHRLGFATDERVFIPAAAMLQQLGIQDVQLMTNNPDKVAQLGKYGITVSRIVPLTLESNPHNEAYLATKRDKTGHLID